MVVALNTIAGLWALGAERYKSFDRREMWWFVAASQASIFLVVIVGVVIVAGDDREGHRFHMFYGFLALVGVAILYSYRSQLRGRLHLLYGLGGLFVAGLLVRAATLTR